jgi:hypothetical protein
MTDEERANLTALLADIKNHVAKEIHNVRAFKAAGLPLDAPYTIPGSQEYIEPPSEGDIANMEYAIGFLTEQLGTPSNEETEGTS